VAGLFRNDARHPFFAAAATAALAERTLETDDVAAVIVTDWLQSRAGDSLGPLFAAAVPAAAALPERPPETDDAAAVIVTDCRSRVQATRSALLSRLRAPQPRPFRSDRRRVRIGDGGQPEGECPAT